MRTLSAIIVCFICLGSPHSGWSNVDERMTAAAAAFQQGRAAYGADDYDTALSFFTEAYNLSGKPDILYNLAICNEKLGHVDKAIAFYDLYLEEKPDAEDADAVRAAVERLRNPDASSDAPDVPRDAVEPSITAPTTTTPQAEQTLDVSAASAEALLTHAAEVRKRRIAQGLLMGGGALIAMSGAITGAAALSRNQTFETTCAPDCTAEQADEVRALTVTTDVLLFTGSAVAVGGMVWMLVDMHREKKRGERSRIGVTFQATGISFQGGF